MNGAIEEHFLYHALQERPFLQKPLIFLYVPLLSLAVSNPDYLSRAHLPPAVFPAVVNAYSMG
jgi:hypothetical protein